MNLEEETKLTYNDVLLVPHKSLVSRAQANPSTTLDKLVLRVPVISANMSSVTELDMATAMYDNGGLGALHRKGGVNPQIRWFKELDRTGRVAFGSVGVHTTFKEIDALLKYTSFLCMDVANAYSEDVAKKITKIKNNYYSLVSLMVGNVATAE